MEEKRSSSDVRINVREHYATLATAVSPQDSCCGPGCGCGTESARPGSDLYSLEELDTLPPEVAALSLGCGNPVAIAELEAGQTVVDLGSGGGIDCFLAARKVGNTGRVIGVDMTPAMIDAARHNSERLGAENVEFRLGEIEHLPLADQSVDVVISNCVINLSPDKLQVLRDAYRVLRPGGRLAVSDIVTAGPLPQAVKDSLSAWAGCVSGALEVDEYKRLLAVAGFRDVDIQPVPIDRESIDQAVDHLEIPLDLPSAEGDEIYRTVFSARITAYKG
jgi:arsenite methyltransferase